MAKQARFHISLSKPTLDTVTVHYATVDGTALAGTNYTDTSGTITFAAADVGPHDVTVPLAPNLTPDDITFTLNLSTPVNATLATIHSQVCTIPGTNSSNEWINRFNFTYDLLTNTANGYFGPTTGPKAYQIPYHAKETAIVVEAPDWTHESASETASFWVKMEAWKSILSGSTLGLEKSWDAIESNWIPDATGQPWGDYNISQPASYVPDAATLMDTPMALSTSKTVGPDPLYTALFAAYNTKAMYLMHWLIDVDGVYGFHNPDGSTKGVFINNYQRGPVEDGLATITHPSFDDFNNGGSSPYGWQAIYGRSNTLYSDGDANAYSKQANYSMAGDADVRAVAAINQVIQLGLTTVVSPSLKAKASKMADYIRYTLYDKYFQPIPGHDGSGCHFLLSWGCGFGVGLPVEGATKSYWGFKIGASEIHHGYNAVDVAYANRTNSTTLNPLAAGSKAMWTTSLDRQLEMIRWLQTSKGPIAGGVTSSWNGRYETPSDARASAKFYGLYYNYSPSWHNPPSNNWTGYQAWGLDRVAGVYYMAATGSAPDDASIATRCGVILDRFVAWFYDNCTVDVDANTLAYPGNLAWTSPTVINGKTSTVTTPKFISLPGNPPVPFPDAYEYLPTLDWPGNSPDYAAFWSGSSVPNPNLDFTILDTGWDPGTAAGFCNVLIQYCAAKVALGHALTESIPNTAITLSSVRDLAGKMLDIIWINKDGDGFGFSQKMEISRITDKLWIPPQFGTGHMPHGEVLQNNVSTFASVRNSFYSTTAEWSALQPYLASPSTVTPPTTTYHRFWNGADVAVAFGMMAYYFPNYVSPLSTAP